MIARLAASVQTISAALQSFLRLPRIKKIRKLVRAYSTQLGFGSFILIFLTFSVGEGRAYDPEQLTATISDEMVENGTGSGFVGKPQVIGQTVLTGETQLAITHIVEPGDSLLSIAKRYSTNVNTIIEANGIKTVDIEKIKAGTALVIPSQDSENSLAWLNELNQLKEEERERARQAELQRLAQQRRNTAASARLPRIASTVGSVDVLGVFRNLSCGTGYNGQCTCYVQHKIPAFRSFVWGNGGNYLASGRRHGFKTGSTAAAGAAVVTTEARVGHVAFVESVNDNGTITISEMNYVRPYVVSRRTISTNSGVIRGYVYPWR